MQILIHWSGKTTHSYRSCCPHHTLHFFRRVPRTPSTPVTPLGALLQDFNGFRHTLPLGLDPPATSPPEPAPPPPLQLGLTYLPYLPSHLPTATGIGRAANYCHMGGRAGFHKCKRACLGSTLQGKPQPTLGPQPQPYPRATITFSPLHRATAMATAPSHQWASGWRDTIAEPQVQVLENSGHLPSRAMGGHKLQWAN